LSSLSALGREMERRRAERAGRRNPGKNTWSKLKKEKESRIRLGRSAIWGKEVTCGGFGRASTRREKNGR